MKTLGRILIILAVFALVMGIAYIAVDASSPSSTAPALERGEGQFPRPDGVQPRFPEGGRPDFDRDGPRGGSWIFGMVRNVVVLAVIVALVIVPKRLMRRRPVAVQNK